jgi:lactonase
MRTRWWVAGAVCVVAASSWVGVGQAATQPGAPQHQPGTTQAQLFATVTGVDPGPLGTGLEGAAFDAKGNFYFVDTEAAAGKPKLMSLDLGTRAVSTLYSDNTSMLNCIGFAPDGTMYLCDLRGKVDSFDKATGTLTDVLDNVDGAPIVPDDLAVAPNGDVYFADYQGTPKAPPGGIVKLSGGKADTELSGLVHPNGIVFAPDYSGLWIDQDLAGTLDHVAYQFPNPANLTPTPIPHAASYLSLGANAYADSLTVDGAGNIYLAVYGGGEVFEFNPQGLQTGKVIFPASAPNVTHVAIQPGTRRAFVTASGPGGGYVYTFPALAPAPANTPNGG